MSMIDRVVVVLGIAVVLTACGGGSGGGSVTQALNEVGTTRGQEATTENDVTQTGSEEDAGVNGAESYSITGSGVKGPIAFGEVSLYKLDFTSRQLYNTSNPIATGSTDQSASITGLTIDSSIEPPFVLVIDGTRGIDLNTNRAPVIKRLINVVTQSHLSEGRPIYATPFTTMAFNMARKSRPQSAPEFLAAMRIAATELKVKLGFGMSSEIDILNDAPLFTGGTVSASQKQLIVEHRAAVEALSAVTNQMATPSGKGLKGEYFNNVDFTDRKLTRIDQSVSFNWGASSPDASIDPDTFSVRWTGFVKPKFTEDYTFHTLSDDGVRVWIDGRLIIDNWTVHGPTENTGTISLVAGVFYPIRIEYFDSTWGSVITLMWSSASEAKSDILVDRLFSDEASTLRNVNPDRVLDDLSDDLADDGSVDGVSSEGRLTSIDLTVLEKDPNSLLIPNTTRTVGETANVMAEELTALGVSSNFIATDASVRLQLAQLRPDEQTDIGTPDDAVPVTTSTSTSSSTSTTTSTTQVSTSTTTQLVTTTTVATTTTTVATTTRASTTSTTASTTTTSTTTTTRAPVVGGFQAKYNPGHYMLIWPTSVVSQEAEAVDLANSVLAGMQVRYLWRDIEPKRGVYDFSKIVSDLAYLQSIGKRLVIQFEMVRWGSSSFGFPDYIAAPEFNGGYFRKTSGLPMAKKYNPGVSARIQALITALGKRFDREPYVEAIVTGETTAGILRAANAADIADYSPAVWRDQIMNIMSAAKRAFPNTTVIQYINWLDKGDRYLANVVEHAKNNGIGIGGPDIFPYKQNHWDGHYKYYPPVAGQIPLGTSVQWEDYETYNPKTGTKNTSKDLLEFGLNELHLNYFFWEIRAPYFLRDVLPLLEARKGAINR